LEDKKNRIAFNIATNFPKLKEKTRRLKADYQVILAAYLDNNLKALRIAKTLTTDTEGLEQLENRIQQRKAILTARVQEAMRK